MPEFQGSLSADPRTAKGITKLNARPPQAAFAAVGVATGADPVCKKAVANQAGTSEYNGKTYSFCSQECKTEFDADPTKYLS